MLTSSLCLLVDLSCYLVCGLYLSLIFFFKQKTAYEMRISDWSSDVCSSDLGLRPARPADRGGRRGRAGAADARDGRCLGQFALGGDRKSVELGKSVSVRVDLGGRRIIKKTKYRKQHKQYIISRTHHSAVPSHPSQMRSYNTTKACSLK